MDSLLELNPGQVFLSVAVFGAAILLVFLVGHYHGMKKAVQSTAVSPSRKQHGGALQTRIVANHEGASNSNRSERLASGEEEVLAKDQSAEQTAEGLQRRNKTNKKGDAEGNMRYEKEYDENIRISTENVPKGFKEPADQSSTPTWRRAGPKRTEVPATNGGETWESGIVRFANDSFGFILRNTNILPPKQNEQSRRNDGALFFLAKDVKYNLSLQRGDRVHYRVQPGNPKATGNKAKPKAADVSLLSRNGVRFDAKEKLQKMKWNKPEADKYRRNSLPNTTVTGEQSQPELETVAQQITEGDFDEDKLNLQSSPNVLATTSGTPTVRRGSLQDDNISAFQSPTFVDWRQMDRDIGFGYKSSIKEPPHQDQINYLRSRIMTEKHFQAKNDER